VYIIIVVIIIIIITLLSLIIIKSISYSDSGFFSVRTGSVNKQSWPVSLKYLYIQMVHCLMCIVLIFCVWFVCSDGRYCAWTLSVVCM